MNAVIHAPKPHLRLPHVVIVGAGFGGLAAAKRLKKAPVRVTLLDRENHHLFQPLLYQVATAGLSPADIASPIRSLVRRQRNTRVLLAEALSIDLDGRTVELERGTLDYDYLVLAAGAATTYFGHDEWSTIAPPMKCMNDAIEVRRRVLMAFEEGERETDPARRRELLDFAVIGGGPTGLELAGAIAELARRALARDFRSIDPKAAQITLLEAGPRLLPTFDPRLSERAAAQLAELDVDARTNARVTRVDEHGVTLASGDHIRAATVIWAAGVRPVALVDTIHVERDRAGRIKVRDDLSIPGHPEAFAIGDVASFEQDGKCLPGLAPVAQQEGRAVARSIVATVGGRERRRFHYFDKGVMATIGRSRAVAQIARLRLSGLIAWLAWVVVHVLTLIGFRNRVVVMFTWIWSYVTFKRGARLITGLEHPLFDGPHEARHLTPAGTNANGPTPSPASTRSPAPAPTPAPTPAW
jgi:NADH dehydrogenase